LAGFVKKINCLNKGTDVKQKNMEWKYGKDNPNDFIVTLLGDTLTYSGRGEIKDSGEYKKPPWYHYRHSVKTIVLESSYSGLSDYILFHFYENLMVINVAHNVVCFFRGGEFEENKYLIEINVDVNNLQYSSMDGVLYNKDKSILICCPTANQEINIPSTVKKINGAAFRGCYELFSVVIPNSVKEIGYSTFHCCHSLSNIIIPNSVEKIGDNAFHGCDNLSSIVRF